jgi:hypothetical protein
MYHENATTFNTMENDPFALGDPGTSNVQPVALFTVQKAIESDTFKKIYI